MKLKNITDNFEFPAFSLFSQTISISAEVQKACQDLSKKRTKLDISRIRKMMSKSLIEALDDLGVELPTDKITFSVSLGSFLFDCYSKGITIPTAPLSKVIFNKKLQTLSEKLVKDEIEIDEDFKDAVERTFRDSKLWNSVVIGAKYSKNGKTHDITFNPSVSEFFPNVYEEALKLFPLDE